MTYVSVRFHLALILIESWTAALRLLLLLAALEAAEASPRSRRMTIAAKPASATAWTELVLVSICCGLLRPQAVRAAELAS